jgi:hypothetical protein
MYKMIDKDKTDKIIDTHVLKFLDEYASTYGVLPDSNVVDVWKMGFVGGCQAISDALAKNSIS